VRETSKAKVLTAQTLTVEKPMLWKEPLPAPVEGRRAVLLLSASMGQAYGDMIGWREGVL
jgi:hypothetical protein